uniref:Polyprotein n=1 Tax=Bursaphelenchus xylophilus TaxID=6326 RepID=A0A1I7SJK6_BURXY
WVRLGPKKARLPEVGPVLFKFARPGRALCGSGWATGPQLGQHGAGKDRPGPGPFKLAGPGLTEYSAP